MGGNSKKGTAIEATVEVARFARGARRFEARPARMEIGGVSVPYRMEDFLAYGWTQRGARKRCLRKVITYLKQRAKKQK
jgi:hypothetical protein